jgi:hypothetical protein
MILPEPTDSEFLINQYVDKLFNKIFDKNIIYRASGVYVEKLTEKATSQLFLFSDEKTEKAKKLSELWDNIEKKYGKNTFSIGTMQNPQNENEIQEQIF